MPTIHKLQRQLRRKTREASRLINSITFDAGPDECRRIDGELEKVYAEIERLEDQIDDARVAHEEEIDVSRRPADPERSALPGGGTIVHRKIDPAVQWRDSKGNVVPVLSREQRAVDQGDLDTSLYGVSFAQAMRALVTGPRDDIERRALSESIDSAGGFTVPAPLAAEFIDALRARTRVISAGAQTVMMDSQTLRMAKVIDDPVVTWRAENAAVGTGDPTFGAVEFSAHSLAGLVRVSRELLEDSANVEQVLLNAFSQSMAVELDRVAMFGSGAGDEPLGVNGVAGISEVSMGTDGAAVTNYVPWLDALEQLETANSPAPTAAIHHPRTQRAINGLTDTTNQPLARPQALAELPYMSTTSVPIDQTQGTAVDASTSLVADWSSLLIGMRQQMRVLVLRERFADDLQVGFLVYMRADVQVEHAARFCRIVGITP